MTVHVLVRVCGTRWPKAQPTPARPDLMVRRHTTSPKPSETPRKPSLSGFFLKSKSPKAQTSFLSMHAASYSFLHALVQSSQSSCFWRRIVALVLCRATKATRHSEIAIDPRDVRIHPGGASYESSSFLSPALRNQETTAHSF